MKKLFIYRENGEFVIERVNQFNHATKRVFVSEEGLQEGIQAYSHVLDEYILQVAEDLWGMVINIVGSPSMISKGQLDPLFTSHKKMYDVRWNGATGDSDEIEKDFVKVAEKNEIPSEVINEMLEQIYIPPYHENNLPYYLKANSHGGRRKGSGRPSIGTTRKVSVTLPDEIWNAIDKKKNNLDISQSQTLRLIIEQYFEDRR
jgi:hypothetical protein